jgi:hypothetical protein
MMTKPSLIYIDDCKMQRVDSKQNFFYKFDTMHYGKYKRKEKTRNATVVCFILIYSHLHVFVISFDHRQGAGY